jgi:drug/metabolite transporter superfamily protein YnfA
LLLPLIQLLHLFCGAFLSSSPMMWRKDRVWNFIVLQIVHIYDLILTHQLAELFLRTCYCSHIGVYVRTSEVFYIMNLNYGPQRKIFRHPPPPPTPRCRKWKRRTIPGHFIRSILLSDLLVKRCDSQPYISLS